METFFTNVTVGNIYFSNCDAVRIIVEKNAANCHTVS